MKGNVCSDFDLGNHFRHMSSKDAIKYEEAQIEHFKNFIIKCIEMEPDILIIVGNLFGNSKPRNLVAETVKTGFNNLTENGTKIFILPGTHDIPLPFTNDIPIHHIFENRDVKFLFNKERLSKAIIDEPIYKIEIDNLKINLFSTPSPLINPKNISFELNLDKNSLNLFLMADINSFKKDIEETFTNLLNSLDKFDLDALLLGGNYPEVPELSDCKFKIIHCPQIHKNNFIYAEKEHGIRMIDIADKDIKYERKVYPISRFNMINKIFNVSNLNARDINENIYNIIKENANPSNNIMRFTLVGKLEKQRYHNLKLFKYSEMGKRRNYYFELLDRIEFLDSSAEIQKLDVKKELEDFIANKMKSESKEVIIDELKLDIEDVYKESLELIKNNWEIDN